MLLDIALDIAVHVCLGNNWPGSHFVVSLVYINMDYIYNKGPARQYIYAGMGQLARKGHRGKQLGGKVGTCLYLRTGRKNEQRVI